MAFHPIAADDDVVAVARPYAWIVFALTFGLLISDYMSRQVLNAVFPLLKGEWALSDGQLGLLSGIVALMVGLLTFPLSLLADRFGRVKSLALMALLWSLATLGCALAQDYQQMFIARFMVGVGEAAYGSVGIAVVISVFPKHMRATLAMLRTADGQGIELDKFQTPDAVRFGPVDTPMNALGLRRIMFAVDDIDALAEKMNQVMQNPSEFHVEFDSRFLPKNIAKLYV